MPKSVERRGPDARDGTGRRGEILDAGDTSRTQPYALAQPEASYQQNVPSLCNLGRALAAPAARRPTGISPVRWPVVRQMLVQQPPQTSAAPPVHGEQICDRILPPRPVTEDEPDVEVQWNSLQLKLLGVAGELEQGWHLRVPGQLGVEDDIPRAASLEESLRPKKRPSKKEPWYTTSASARSASNVRCAARRSASSEW
jgi:hypothetical protein